MPDHKDAYFLKVTVGRKGMGDDSRGYLCYEYFVGRREIT